MPHPLRRSVAAVSLAAALALGACSNSTGDAGTATTTSGGGSTNGGGGGEATRDEFVPIEGVPGVSDEEIRYTVIGTKTGNPLGTCILDCYVEGIEAYFAYRNSEGGIYGRDLVIGSVLDDELSQNQQRSLDVVSSGNAFGAFQATLLATGWGDLDQAGVPTYTWGIHATEAANRQHIFPSLTVRCPNCPRAAVPYAAAQANATRAASLGYGISENSKVCATTVAEAFDIHEADSGVEVVYVNDDLDYGLPNGIGPEVTAMKAAGVDFIATCIDLNGMKTLAQELARQQMDDVVLYHPNSYDRAFVAEAGDLFEGDIVTVQFRPFEATAEGNGLEVFQQWMAELGHEPTELAMVGWINATMAFDGLLAAGPDFDRASVVAAFNSLSDYTADGLVHAIDWSVGHTPYTVDDPGVDEEVPCSALVRIVDGGFEPLEDPERPWLCWEPGVTPPFDPEPTNFD